MLRMEMLKVERHTKIHLGLRQGDASVIVLGVATTSMCPNGKTLTVPCAQVLPSPHGRKDRRDVLFYVLGVADRLHAH